MITPKIITAPTTEAISETELLQQLSIDDATGVNLTIYRQAAREYYESCTGRTMHETEWEWVMDAFPGGNTIVLPRATPLISVTSVTYLDSDGTENTLAASKYVINTWDVLGSLTLAYGEQWPSFTAYPVAPIRIRYKAGIETASPITEANDADKIPILMLAAALFRNREAVVVADRTAIAQISVQCGAKAFIWMRKVAHAN